MHAQLGRVFQIAVRGEGRGISSLQWRGNKKFYLGGIFLPGERNLRSVFDYLNEMICFLGRNPGWVPQPQQKNQK